VGELEARNKIGRSVPIKTGCCGFDPGKNFLEIGSVYVVGDAEIAVPLHLGPAPELRGDELAITV
jgi:hypothetical protein